MFLRVWFSASSQSWRRSSQDRFQATSMDSALKLTSSWLRFTWCSQRY